MKILSVVALVLLACAVTGLSQTQTPSASKKAMTDVLTAFNLPTDPDLKIVQKFFESAAVTRFTLSTESKDLSAPEKHALAWLIQEFHKAKQRHYHFRIARFTAESKDNYKMRRLTTLTPKAVRENMSYIQLQYFPAEGLACPEFHAVIEIGTLSIISKWSEGG